jgi:hypothetical protein
MPTVVVHGIDTSITSLGAPTYAQINDALSSIQLMGPAGDLGGWVGPRPRVTRVIRTGAPRAWEVHFAWPYSWPDGGDDARVRAQLTNAVQRQLAPVSADWAVTLEPYAPAVNGELTWWSSGAGSVTQTGDIWPTAGGRLDAQENPIGPTTAATHPGTLAEAAGAAVGGATNFMKALLPLLLLFGGVYLAGQVGAFTRKAAPRRRRTPPPWEALGRPVPAGAVRNPDYARMPFLAALNPRPAEWGQYAPSTPYPCHPWEAGILGLHVPGRGGGTVTACATPAEPLTARRRRGQVQIGLPGVGGVMPKARARARVRRAGLETLRTPLEDVAQAAAIYSGASCPLPYPPGLEFPHIVSRCDPEHKVWKGFDAALDDARERASIVAGDDVGPAEFDCLVVEELSRDARFPAWRAAADACVRGFQSRQSSRRGKAAFSQQRERGQARARAIAEGVDVSGAEYRDTLRSAESKRRRNYERDVNAYLESVVANYDRKHRR